MSNFFSSKIVIHSFSKRRKIHRLAVIRDELAIFAETMEGFQRSRSGIIIPMSNFICGANGC